MTVRHRFLYLGVFLVAVGGVTLAAQGDLFGSDAAAQALRLWPVVLIALGAGLLLHRTRFGLAGGLVAAAMPGLLLGGALVAAPRLVPGSSQRATTSANCPPTGATPSLTTIHCARSSATSRTTRHRSSPWLKDRSGAAHASWSSRATSLWPASMRRSP